MIVCSILVLYLENGIRVYINCSGISYIAKCHLVCKQGELANSGRGFILVFGFF